MLWYDSTVFYLQCAINFVHKNENFRQKPFKGNGIGRIREGKERGGPTWIFYPGIPEFLDTPVLPVAFVHLFFTVHVSAAKSIYLC